MIPATETILESTQTGARRRRGMARRPRHLGTRLYRKQPVRLTSSLGAMRAPRARRRLTASRGVSLLRGRRSSPTCTPRTTPVSSIRAGNVTNPDRPLRGRPRLGRRDRRRRRHPGHLDPHPPHRPTPHQPELGASALRRAGRLVEPPVCGARGSGVHAIWAMPSRARHRTFVSDGAVARSDVRRCAWMRCLRPCPSR